MEAELSGKALECGREHSLNRAAQKPSSPVWITPKLVTRQSTSTQAEEGPKREERTQERVLRATQDTERTTSQHLRLPGTVIHWFCFVYIKNQTQDSRNLVVRR